VAALFFVLGRKPRPLGFFSGLYFALYGPVRFVLDTLRVDDARYFGWTPAQYLCVLMTIAGVAMVVWSLRNQRREVSA
jgi:phosphatidylglycerol:prolipoprotein diacylglycerol transferase